MLKKCKCTIQFHLFQADMMTRQVEMENLYDEVKRERDQLLEQNRRVRNSASLFIAHQRGLNLSDEVVSRISTLLN